MKESWAIAARGKLSALGGKIIALRMPTLLAGVLCLVGIFLRLYFFKVNRSLWLDEALLANNIVQRSFSGLLAPLGGAQVAPLAFLLLEKFVITIAGAKDWTLRLIPLWAGLISLPLMYVVARRYVDGRAPLLALALLAFSTQLLYYSSEVKQYSTDVLATLLLLWAVPRCLEKEAEARAFVTLGIVGICVLWLSQPAVFVFGGIGVTLSITMTIRRDWRRLLWLSVVGALAGATLILLYFVSLRYAASNAYLLQFWRGTFAPLPPWKNWAWYWSAWNGAMDNPAGLPVGPVMAAIFLIGLCFSIRRKWELGLVLLLPVLLTLVASSLRLYPFNGRLLIFATPMLLLVPSAGVDGLRRLTEGTSRPLSWLLYGAGAVYLLFSPIGAAYQLVQTPPRRGDIKPILGYVRAHRLQSDTIYVYSGAQAAFEFYAHQYDFRSKNFVIGKFGHTNTDVYTREMDNLSGRVWFVFTHERAGQADDMAFFLTHLDKVGVRLDQFDAAGASVFLYELDRKP